MRFSGSKVVELNISNIVMILITSVSVIQILRNNSKNNDTFFRRFLMIPSFFCLQTNKKKTQLYDVIHFVPSNLQQCLIQKKMFTIQDFNQVRILKFLVFFLKNKFSNRYVNYVKLLIELLIRAYDKLWLIYTCW